MTNLFPVLYVILFVIVIFIVVLGFVNRNNEDSKDYFTFASIGLVGRQLQFWLGDSSVPHEKDSQEQHS